ncbi:hypothetical protein [Mycobacterium aquaticum]|uniref:Histidine kinase/HSP90-like ATPase domain-containing protein n=1 Tax=Mycobacterium aquaticum TaxID=1927124 RepID=A0A1X0BCE1_9MYCO|nr:hypothetical protein [Mycobacterium aquaticum]ORA40002.1 hypothetical protein BST13_01180 [Mycobacterium aquaticum]
MTVSRDYATGVQRALSTAGLYFAGVAPIVQFAIFHAGTPGTADRGVVWVGFTAHAVTWLLAVLRKVPAPLVLVTWSLIGVILAVEATTAGATEPVAPRNISLTIAATAALLLPTWRAIAATTAISLASAATLLLTAARTTTALWSMAAQIPVYAVGVAAALALAMRELTGVARAADDEARTRLAADRTVRRKELAGEASRRRARIIHDTVVNTLGAIANSRIAASDTLVAQRCAEDARLLAALRCGATPIDPAVGDVFTHATEVGITLHGANVEVLAARLDSEESWRRREIVSALKETVTNVAKHAEVSEAWMVYDASMFTVTVTDRGTGMLDTGPLTGSLSARAQDAQAEFDATSDPGRGTTVRMRIAPLRDGSAGVFEVAAARMASAIAGVMLAQFAAVSVVTLSFDSAWTVPNVLAPTATWLVVAGILALIITGAADSQRLPARRAIAVYLGIMVMAAIYNATKAAPGACGLHPHLAWVGDAVATICAVLVLMDGRARVVLPAVLLTVVAVVTSLRDVHAECRAMTFGLFITDLLVIGAFYILRRQTLRLSNIVAAQHSEQIRRREEQERLAVESALNDDGFDATLSHSEDILQAVADRPARVRDTYIRTAAGLEEGYLRALIGLTTDVVAPGIKQRFVTAIDTARTAGVRVGVHAEPGVITEQFAEFAVTAVRPVIDRCAAGDELSIGIFGPAVEPTLIIVAPPHSLRGYAVRSQDQGTQINVTADLGLVEVRWFSGTHRDCR